MSALLDANVRSPGRVKFITTPLSSDSGRVSDAYWRAVAMSWRGRLITFDRKIQRLVPAGYPEPPLTVLGG